MRTDKTDLQEKVLEDIKEERDFQDKKWGPNRNLDVVGYSGRRGRRG